jgi:hypothetical protein
MSKYSVQIILKDVFQYDDAEIFRFNEYAQDSGITLAAYLNGTQDRPSYGFEAYTDAEQEQILEALVLIVSHQIQSLKEDGYPLANNKQPTYIATAGAPGVMHPQLLHQTFAINPSQSNLPENAFYLAPDDWVLPKMPCYQEDLKTFGHQQAYKKWRDSSNFITNFLHALAASHRMNIIHDSTSTNPISTKIYAALKSRGYRIEFLLIFAEQQDRATSLQNNIDNGGPVVSIPEMLQKSKGVFQRLMDTYFVYADRIAMFYNSIDKADNSYDFHHFANFSAAVPDGMVHVMHNQQQWLAKLKSDICEECKQYDPVLGAGLENVVANGFIVLPPVPKSRLIS